jgi:colanic acid biosynthesis glycosyl transferase WcaI
MLPNTSGSMGCAAELNLLILSLVFPPDSVSTGEIMGDLAADLRDSGHSVTVLTTTPHYNPDPAAERQQPLRPYWGRLLQQSDYHGIRVYHAAIPSKTPSVIGRILGWIGFHVVSTVAGVVTVPRPEVILTPSPPLSIGVSAWIIAALRGARYIYNVQEIYPDIAVNLGALRNRAAIRTMEALERFVYRKSAAVTVIAPRMRERLVAKGVRPEKVHVLPNFVDLRRLTPVPRHNEFSRQQQLDDCFSVTYAGNMGPAQGLDIVIEAARLLSMSDGRIRFLLIGEGILRESLTSSAAALPLRNVTVLPYQPTAMMPQIYSASDISLVPQAAATGFDAIPSKVYRIMATARPLIAVTDTTSDLAALVRDAGCGVIVAPGDARGFADVVRRGAANRNDWEAMGLRGREYVSANYSRAVVSARYDRLIRDVGAGVN